MFDLFNNKDDKKWKIIKDYNKTAKYYDSRYHKIQNAKYNVSIKGISLINKLILDGGCGTGLFFEFLIKNEESNLIKNITYVGIDVSIKMLEIFKEKRLKIQVKKRAKPNLILSDIENLPFRKASFDAIFTFTSIQNLANPLRGIRELLYTGKNNGVWISSILKKKINEKIQKELKLSLRDLKIINLENLEDIIYIGFIKKINNLL
ncbi:MAG: class I SAM-dependent methyltransferase [Promethearchaeia archaeon]